MSLKYTEHKIREALSQASGNTTRAQQILIKWCADDPKLLLGLTKNHLTGIVAYHIDRISSGRAEPSGRDSKPKAAPNDKEWQVKGMNTPVNSFGLEVLKAVSRSDASIFGMEGYAGAPQRGRASQSHINAIKHLAKKQDTENKK